MFDIGFTELLLVGLVALMVLGPERLPGAVRTTGLWVGAEAQLQQHQGEVEREIGADEIRRQLHNERILDLEREMKQASCRRPPATRPPRRRRPQRGAPASPRMPRAAVPAIR